MNITLNAVKFDSRGLIPAIVQDAQTMQVLMLAYMNRESLSRTIESGETWFWSRSRNELWHKGETSGNTQRVVDLRLDCDGDAIAVRVEPAGPSCHTGQTSCFHNPLHQATQTNSHKRESDLGGILSSLYEVVGDRKLNRPSGSYTSYLFDQGLDKILKKIGEEASETIIAAKNSDRGALIGESCDLIYHLLVLLSERDISLNDLRDELTRRASAR
jgi:phosphoribosyl-AMP cyclohydrolase / phosphoribosyl-ATP pyrophosphohydrolase